jgi:hypothetical protein
MRLDQRQPQFVGRAIDRRRHGCEQRSDPRERPQRGRLPRDPRRMLKHICQRGDEIVLAANV